MRLEETEVTGAFASAMIQLDEFSSPLKPIDSEEPPDDTETIDAVEYSGSKLDEVSPIMYIGAQEYGAKVVEMWISFPEPFATTCMFWALIATHPFVEIP